MMGRAVNKRGSYIVFVTMIIASIMILIYSVLAASEERAVSSATKNFGRVWGRSILAEYDRVLKDRYGLFAYYGNEFSVEEKLDFYADYSFKGKRYIDYGGAKCSLDDLGLLDEKHFAEQMNRAVLLGAKPVPLYKSGEEATDKNAYISNKRIINSLPSDLTRVSGDVLALVKNLIRMPSLYSIYTSPRDIAYTFKYFKNNLNDNELGDTYFDNEVEYIISGVLDDKQAVNSVKVRTFFLRNDLNVLYLYINKDTRESTFKLAQSIAGGEAALVVQAIIIEAWAAYEASNDIKLLYAGKPVPLFKSEKTWATNVKNVIKSKFGIDLDLGVTEDDRTKTTKLVEDMRRTSAGGEEALMREYVKGDAAEGGGEEGKKDYIEPEKMEGLDYDGYLKIFLALVPDDARKGRIQNLIQINMKYLYCDYFLLKDYYVGAKYSLEVNDNEYEFNEAY